MNRNVLRQNFVEQPRLAFRPSWPEREVLVRCKGAVKRVYVFCGKGEAPL
jgi:hypothetical protein